VTIPDAVAPGAGTAGERKLFLALREHLPADHVGVLALESATGAPTPSVA
jgi:hypothetical protein